MQQPNEGPPQRSASAGPARRPPLRPHLVSGGERCVSFDSDVQMESAVGLDRAAVGMHSLEPRWEEARAQSPEQLAPLTLPYGATKRAVDVLGAIVLAVVFSP